LHAEEVGREAEISNLVLAFDLAENLWHQGWVSDNTAVVDVGADEDSLG
jgi:hypothetical protein